MCVKSQQHHKKVYTKMTRNQILHDDTVTAADVHCYLKGLSGRFLFTMDSPHLRGLERLCMQLLPEEGQHLEPQALDAVRSYLNALGNMGYQFPDGAYTGGTGKD